MGRVSRFKKTKNIDPFESLHKEEQFLKNLDKSKLKEDSETSSYKRFKKLLEYDETKSKKHQKKVEKNEQRKKKSPAQTEETGLQNKQSGRRPGETVAEYNRRIKDETRQAHITAARKLNRGVQIKREYHERKKREQQARREAKIAANLKKVSKRQEFELKDGEDVEDTIFNML